MTQILQPFCSNDFSSILMCPWDWLWKRISCNTGMSILHGAFIRLPRLSVSLTMTASWYSLMCIHPPCFEGFLWKKDVGCATDFWQAQVDDVGPWQCVSGICGSDSNTWLEITWPWCALRVWWRESCCHRSYACKFDKYLLGFHILNAVWIKKSLLHDAK